MAEPLLLMKQAEDDSYERQQRRQQTEYERLRQETYEKYRIANYEYKKYLNCFTEELSKWNLSFAQLYLSKLHPIKHTFLLKDMKKHSLYTFLQFHEQYLLLI